jgi:hypothetical protein
MKKEENLNCQNCGKKINEHNFYLHDRMCDDCFLNTYFPDPNYEILRKEINKQKTSLNQKYLEFLGKKEIYFEKKFKLSKYIEPLLISEENIPILLDFIKQLTSNKLMFFKTYDGFVMNISELNLNGFNKEFLMNCFELEEYQEDDYISFAISDLNSFYISINEGMFFFSGNEEATKIMEKILINSNTEYSLEETNKYHKTK